MKEKRKAKILELINFYADKDVFLRTMHPISYEQLAADETLVEKCTEIISNALMVCGFEESWEPNSVGYSLEDAIDFLNEITFLGKENAQKGTE